MLGEEDIASLRSRVERAERRTLISSILSGISTFLLGVVVLAGWNTQDPTIAAQEFRVVNDAGEPTGYLQTTAGGSMLQLQSDDGSFVSIDADTTSETGVRLFDATRMRAELELNGDEGSPTFRLSDSSGNTRLVASILQDSPIIMLADAASTRRASLSQTKEGPSLRLFDTTGEARVGIFVGTDGPGLATIGPSGQTIWSAP